MRIGFRCLRRKCLVSHTWRKGLLDGWSLRLRLNCSACLPQKMLCWSTVTRYSLPPHEKMSTATRCQGLFGTFVIMKDSAGWRSAHVGQVAQACTYYRISADMPGQNIKSLALLNQEFMPRWPTWNFCFISDLIARRMTILCPLSISPSCAVNSSM